MINILTAAMIEAHGTSLPKSTRVMHAQGIVALFPYLEDPFSKHGCVGTLLRSRQWFRISCMAFKDHSKNNCRRERCLS
ncbi:hypothetical protein AMECASPLE_035942 [Ameca splendens]|uniref:Uncharacterized protein n=1 Tax=Ameca splendens TaxID=208324 RepID=A0ABV0Y7K1_9TELE